MLAHSGYFQLFILAWRAFVFFISETKLSTRSRVSWVGMSQYHSPSAVAMEEKERKEGENKDRSQV